MPGMIGVKNIDYDVDHDGPCLMPYLQNVIAPISWILGF